MKVLVLPRPNRPLKVLMLTATFLICGITFGQTRNKTESSDQKIADDIKALNDEDKENRFIAALDLANKGPDAVEAVPGLMNALAHDTDQEVRSMAANALSQIGPGARQAIPVLISALGTDSDNGTREHSAAALGAIGPDARQAVPALIHGLAHDTSDDARASCAQALGEIGPDANGAGKALAAAVQGDKALVVRQSAVLSIPKIKPKPSEVIPALIGALHNETDEHMRIAACIALKAFGEGAAEAVPQLITTISKDTSDTVRICAGAALAEIGPKAKGATPTLIKVLQNDGNGAARAYAARGLGSIGPDAKQAVPALIEALSKDSDARVRGQAVTSLGVLGFGTKDAVPSLIAAFKSDKDKNVQNAAAESLVTIAEAVRDAKQTDLIGQLSEIEQVFKSNSYPAHAKRIQTVLEVLQAIRPAPPVQHSALYSRLREHPRIIAALCGYLLLGLICLSLLWIYPKALWQINEIGLFSRQVKLPDWIGGGTASLAQVLVFGFFRYHPRVLDTWISSHISTTIDTFGQMVTVEERAIYVDVPVELEKRIVLNLKPADLKGAFDKKRVCLLIWGEGGVGKTSLACQIAKWVMSRDKMTRPLPQRVLPVFIEEELNLDVPKDRDVLIEAVRGKLRDLTGTAEAPSEELVRHLLKQRRVMMVVDGLSELSQATRNKIQPSNPDFAVNVLLITSRIDEPLDAPIKTRIRPLRVQGNRLSSFMDAYLVERGKRTLFDDQEFFDGCSKLSAIVGDRETTILLAKLFADQMIASKEKTVEALPESIPDLMLEYLNDLNRKEQGLDDRTVHSVAKTIAWICLSKTYRPTPAKISEVLNGLGGGDAAKDYLSVLEQKLRLIQVIGVGRDLVKFALDPLSEYLAGLYVVEQYRDDEALWSDFLVKSKSVSDGPQSTASFLLAVYDCCIVKGPEWNVPRFVSERLAAQISALRDHRAIEVTLETTNVS